MSKVKVVLVSSGVRELMKSGEIMDFMEEKANEIVKRCSETSQYDVEKWQNGKTRGNVRIVNSDKETYFRNKATNELLKGMGQDG